MAKGKDEHAKHYSEKEFWKKVKTTAEDAGKTVIESATTLYYVLQDKDTPLAAKGIILGALGYFILPLDVIPDFLPGGFVDDLAVLGAALSAVAVSVKEGHKQSARKKVKEWFKVLKEKSAEGKAKIEEWFKDDEPKPTPGKKAKPKTKTKKKAAKKKAAKKKKGKAKSKKKKAKA
jgi:uncharacterized membrane protein YkvA (DUF1232 family)